MTTDLFSSTEPLTVLRLCPLITSTATLMYAHDNDLFFRGFLHEQSLQNSKYKAQVNEILPQWLKNIFHRAGLPIFTLYPATILLSLANVFVNIANDNAATAGVGMETKLYAAGLAFTLAHFLFAKRALSLFARILEDKSQGDSTSDLKAWVDNNIVRTFLVDGPGWVCFLGAVVMGLEVRKG